MLQAPADGFPQALFIKIRKQRSLRPDAALFNMRKANVLYSSLQVETYPAAERRSPLIA